MDFEKTPLERLSLGVNISGIPENVTISSGTISAWDIVDDSDASTELLVSTVLTIDESSARFTVRNGSSGGKYGLRLLLALSNGDILEEDITLYVNDK